MDFTLTPAPKQIRHKPGVFEAAKIGRLESEFELPASIRDSLSAGPGKGPLPLRVLKRALKPRGAYRLDIAPGGITLAAADTEGVRYGARRLAQWMQAARARSREAWAGPEAGPPGLRLPCARIQDAPALPLRGVHLYFPALRHLEADKQIGLLDVMARWNLNAVILEYGNRFPYRRHARLAAPDAFSRAQVRRLIRRAGELGIEVIPLHQSLGHLEHVLRHNAYAGLREEQARRDQWCPLNPQSLSLFREMADDFIETHRPARYFHLGGDEARCLGVCPACAARAAGRGIGRLYLDFMLQALAHIRSRGLVPILWDDIVCRHIEVLDELPRDVVLMYWDYWTTNHPSAMFVARPAGRGQVADRRWQSAWRPELDPVEARMLDAFARPLDLERDLPAGFRKRFRKYLGPDFPKRVPAFPFLPYYQDHGFTVIGAGTISGNTSTWEGLPDFPRYAANLSAFAGRVQETSALGLVGTLWYPMPLEAYAAGIMFAGQAAWAGRPAPDKKRG